VCSARLPNIGWVGIDNQFCSTAMFFSLLGSQLDATIRLRAGCHHSDDEKAKSFRCLMRAIVIVESLFLLALVYANEAGNG